MEVTAFAIREQRFDDWERKLTGRWSIEDMRADDRYRNGWLSFDCLAWDDARQTLFAGLTLISTDIFWAFDPATESFTSLGFPDIADQYDAKLHRSIERDSDGTYLIATALLHDMDQQFKAPGGKLVRYDPETRTYELLGRPVPRQYIQSICLDRTRRVVYGFTYPAECMFAYDLARGTSRILAYLGNARLIAQSHNAVVDPQGRVWGTWGENRAYEYEIGPKPIRFFCYDPATDTFEWFDFGPPKTWPGDTGAIDHMLVGTDGLIYIGTVAGGLSCLNPLTHELKSFGKPYPGTRLAGLVQARDGALYGAGNAGLDAAGRGTSRLFRFDPATGGTTDLGPIFDPQRDDGAGRVHMLVEGEPGVFYAGENDNHYRSSYLWRCRVTE